MMEKVSAVMPVTVVKIREPLGVRLQKDEDI
jgi:hypothetical protein